MTSLVPGVCVRAGEGGPGRAHLRGVEQRQVGVQQRLLLSVQVYAQGLLRPVGGEAAGGAGRHQARPRLVRQAASSQPLAARGLRPRQRGVRLQLRRRPAEEGSELGGAEVPSLHLW